MKKYWKDYHKWNLDQYLTLPSHVFPDPIKYLEDDTGNKFELDDTNNCSHPCVMKIEYNVYVNEQPKRLPLDHVSTLKNAFEFLGKC